MSSSPLPHALEGLLQAVRALDELVQRMSIGSNPAQRWTPSLPQQSAPSVLSGGPSIATGTAPAEPAEPAEARSRTKVGPNQPVPGTTLRTDANGDLTIDQDGAVIDGVEITGIVRVRAANVTIRNSTITGRATGKMTSALVDSSDRRVRNLVVENSVLRPGPGVIAGNGIHGGNYTARNNDISRTVDGLGVFNTGGSSNANVVIEGNYIHDLAWFNGAIDGRAEGTHNDGIQIHGGNNVLIRGNRIDIRSARDTGSTSDPKWTPYGMQAVMVQQITGTVSNVVIDGNTIGGGTSGVHLFSKAAGSLGAITVSNNTFTQNGKRTGDGMGIHLLINGVANPASVVGIETNLLDDGRVISTANRGVRSWVK